MLPVIIVLVHVTHTYSDDFIYAKTDMLHDVFVARVTYL